MKNEGQVVATLQYAKQKKYESMEDYGDRFFWLCVVIPQQSNDIYLSEVFREVLWTKLKMAIINKPRTLAKVAKSAILVKEKLPMRWKNMARYHPNNSNNDEYKDIDDKNKHYEKKTRNKPKKVNIETIKEGVYFQNCFNEGHFTKECKLLMKLCQIYKANDHNMDQCPSKVVNGSCPSRKIIPVHVVQVEIPIVQE